jgi:hypothetical protein
LVSISDHEEKDKVQNKALLIKQIKVGCHIITFEAK